VLGAPSLGKDRNTMTKDGDDSGTTARALWKDGEAMLDAGVVLIQRVGSSVQPHSQGKTHNTRTNISINIKMEAATDTKISRFPLSQPGGWQHPT
jgi:hypothetical protein